MPMRNESLSTSVTIAQDIVLQPFERVIVRAKLLANDLEPFMFRTVLINFQTPSRMLKNVFFLEDTVATVGETGFPYISLGNLTSNVQRAKRGNPFRDRGTCHNGSQGHSPGYA